MPAVSSVATIDQPQFIDVQSISPFVAKCKIKVLYVGQNRNGSFISKLVATNMAKTLPACPIVGYYKEEVGDLRDHGEVITIAEHKINVEKKTHPIGFIAPDAKIWFQIFEDTDEYGNSCLREYLVVEGFLWTQFEGSSPILADGSRPQSMELDEATLEGFWSEDEKTNMEIFIINDAKFKALCGLGKDVEPCFEGSSIAIEPTEANYSLSIDNNKEFINDLSNMMKQLQFTLNKLEGGKKMANVQDKVDETTSVKTQSNMNEFEKKEEEKKNEPTPAPEDSKEENKEEAEEDDKKKKVANNSLEEFEKKEDEKKDESESKEEEKKDESKEEEKKDDDKKDYSLLETQYEELKTQFAALQESYAALEQFKTEVENSKKDELIASFYMLDDADKKDVIDNKTKYSLDEIESKLSVICVRKKVNFNLDSDAEEKKVEKEDPLMYNLNGQLSETDTLPAWLKAVEEHSKNND